ncbi:MAG: hypothetical protein JW704_11275, partial [Anaerolineaceae bacterium]|nr:hypothetical protein [Anaerolineaceae bacterium]
KTATVYRAIGIAQNVCANCLRYVHDLEFEQVDGQKVAVGVCDCYRTGLFSPVQYPDEKVPEFKERMKQYKENSYEEFHAALLDVEKDFDPDWAAKLGVDPSRLYYVQPDTMEIAIDIYDDLFRTAEVDLLVVDSIAAMAPSVEIEKSAEEWQQGLQARLMGKMTRKTTAGATVRAKAYGRFPTQIWINQLREKIGGSSFVDNRVMPAGNSQLFTASVIMDMWTSKWEKEVLDPELPEDLRSQIGTKVRVTGKVLKNKTAPALQVGSYDLIVAGDEAGRIDELKYLLAQAEKYKLFEVLEEGKKKTWRVGDETFEKKGDAISRMLEPKTYWTMRDILLQYMTGLIKVPK